MIERKCRNCNKAFYTYPVRIRQGRAKFCSRECQNNYGRIKRICLTCGKEFSFIKSRLRMKTFSGKYCSLGCYHKNQTVIKKKRCKICGRLFKPYHTLDKAIYCSRKCRFSDIEDLKRIQSKRERIPKPRKKFKCPICDKVFHKLECTTKNWVNTYCSDKCRLKALTKIGSPNGIEKRIIRLIKRYNLPFEYVGDGSFWIGKMNPDFIATDDSKRVIEIFGKCWHDPKYCSWKRTEWGRKAMLSQLGYKVLVLWYPNVSLMKDENIVKKIEKF